MLLQCNNVVASVTIGKHDVLSTWIETIIVFYHVFFYHSQFGILRHNQLVGNDAHMLSWTWFYRSMRRKIRCEPCFV